MRTLFILAALTAICLSTKAQTSVGDSLRYYQRLYYKLEHRVIDSVRDSDSGVYFLNKFRQLKDRSRQYTAFMLISELSAADYSTLNAAIAPDGFGAFTGPVWRFGLGVSHKAYNGIMIDFNYAIFGVNRVKKSGDNKISASFYNLLGLELGYAVVNTSRFNVYPYAGLTLRNSSLSYSKPAALNSNFTSIANLVNNDQSADGNSTHLGYDAGLGIEYAIGYNKKSHGGTMLFGKFGTDGIFGDETYRISGVDYHSGIKYGAWMAELGFKFFGR